MMSFGAMIWVIPMVSGLGLFVSEFEAHKDRSISLNSSVLRSESFRTPLNWLAPRSEGGCMSRARLTLDGIRPRLVESRPRKHPDLRIVEACFPARHS